MADPEELGDFEFLTSLPGSDRLAFLKTSDSNEDLLKGCTSIIASHENYSRDLIELALSGGSVKQVILLISIGTASNPADLIEGATVSEKWNLAEKESSKLHSIIAME